MTRRGDQVRSDGRAGRAARAGRAGRTTTARPRAALIGAVAAAALAATPGGPARADDLPAGPHPRLVLDPPLRAAWRAAAGRPGSAVERATRRCAAARAEPREYDRDSYMGFDWAATTYACLISHVARGDAADAATALRYVTALLDDLQVVGDGRGGELAVRRDSGYAIRSMAPAVALAYDWLHDDPRMTEALRARARARLGQWLTWYRASGYHARTPATNYHAGYLLAAELAAVALAGEAPDLAADLWRHVVADLWGTDMKRALAPGGVLDGGDFPEGWQYAPLSVAEYALAWRVAAPRGVRDDGVGRWLGAMLARTIHAQSATDRTPALGDADHGEPSLPVNPLTLAAILIADAPAAAQRHAAAELARLRLDAHEYPLFDALAEARGAAPEPAPRARWPRAYYTAGLGVLYARTSWEPGGVWLAAMCGHAVDADHTQPSAGNLVLTRGRDELLIDPSPYGGMSSLTSNAPTVESRQLPEEYKPSQGYWGRATGHAWAAQSAGGVIAASCDYADQYRFQDVPTDVPAARREVVVVPWAGGDATAVVVDRAASGDRARGLWLRFRTPGTFAMPTPGVATAAVGDSVLTVRRVRAPGGTPEVRRLAVGDCFAPGVARGKCDAARVPTGEYRLTLPGPAMEALHVLDAAGPRSPALAVDEVPGAPEVLRLRRGGVEAYVATSPRAAYEVPAPAAGRSATHVVIPAPAPAADPVAIAAGPGAAGPRVRVAAARRGERCAVTVGDAGGVEVAARPAVFTVDAACQVAADPLVGPVPPPLDGAAAPVAPVGPAPGGPTAGAAAGSSAASAALPPGGAARHRSARVGCLDAGAGQAGGLAVAGVVGARLGARSRRRRGRANADKV